MKEPTEKPRRMWSDEDKAFIEQVTEEAFKQSRCWYKAKDFKLFKEIDELLTGILIVEELLGAFRSSPDQKIDGSHGVAAQLGLTRNGVYCRLDIVKLDPADFRDPNAELGSLVQKSPVLRSLVKKMLDRAKGSETLVGTVLPNCK